MYTSIKIIDVTVLKRMFPCIKDLLKFEQEIKALHFLAFEFTKGFKIQKGSFSKKLKENKILVGDSKFSNEPFILSDAEAQHVGLLG